MQLHIKVEDDSKAKNIYLEDLDGSLMPVDAAASPGLFVLDTDVVCQRAGDVELVGVGLEGK